MRSLHAFPKITYSKWVPFLKKQKRIDKDRTHYVIKQKISPITKII
jgi:hypothetical protein